MRWRLHPAHANGNVDRVSPLDWLSAVNCRRLAGSRDAIPHSCGQPRETANFHSVTYSDIAASGSSCGKRSAKTGTAAGMVPSASTWQRSRWHSEAAAYRCVSDGVCPVSRKTQTRCCRVSPVGAISGE